MNTETTRGIKVSVNSYFQDTEPLDKKFVHSYKIKIENNSQRKVQLLRRHWMVMVDYITFKVVEGAGVVGLQPILEPNASHEYVSWVILEAEIGKMGGSYLMIDLETEETFKITVPQFTLTVPYKFN